MVALAPGTPDASLEDVLDSIELALEAIDQLRSEVGDASAPTPDERPDQLLAELARLHRRVEEIAEASWRRSEDDRLQHALDAIDRLRVRVDDADPSAAILQTLDLVSHVAARLDDADGQALAELTLEAVEDLGRRAAEDGHATRATRAGLDRAVAELEHLREEIAARDPSDAIELALEAMDDVGERVDRRADAMERRLAAMESELAMLGELAATAARSLAAPALDAATVDAIADRVVAALMGQAEQVLGSLVPGTPAALPAVEQHAAVVASAAAAMSRLEGRLDSDFGSVERSVDRLDRHLAELEGLLREERENGRAAEPAAPRARTPRWRGRAARR
jgi:hypothetical protein